MPIDDAAEPLIAPERPSSDHDIGGEIDIGAVKVAPGLFVWTLTLTAALSGLLFGYDTGVISSTLVSIHSDLSHHPLTTLDKSLITSITSIFALLASPTSGLLADFLGRKPVILLSDVLFIVGALCQAFATTVGGMIAGRAIVGLAIGAASFLTPLYIAELSPADWRGRLVTVSALFITGGQVIAYVVGWGFATHGGGWRWMVGLGAVPAAIQLLLGTFAGMPETPRWLVKAGKVERARGVLDSVYGDEDSGKRMVNSVLRQVIKEIEEEERSGGKVQGGNGIMARLERTRSRFGELVNGDVNRRALLIACMLQGAQQLCGFNSLMYFSATIFAMIGFRNPTATSLLIAITNFLFTLIAFYLIDRIGRRRILLLSIPVMSLGLLLSGLAFSHVSIPTHPTPSSELSTPQPPGPWPVLLTSALIIFVAAYALGIGNVPWHQSELFPLSVRALGSALATATNWACNSLVGITFLPMMELLTPGWTFVIYAGVCGAAWVGVWWVYPERMGKGLEDVNDEGDQGS